MYFVNLRGSVRHWHLILVLKHSFSETIFLKTLVSNFRSIELDHIS